MMSAKEAQLEAELNAEEAQLEAELNVESGRNSLIPRKPPSLWPSRYIAKYDTDKLSTNEQPEFVKTTITQGATGAEWYQSGRAVPVTPISNKDIAKKFSRMDRLNYGFTFELIQDDGQIFDITLFINPEELTQVEPARITVTQTKGGAFVDHFGRGLKTITMRGVTGFHVRNIGGTPVSGQQHFLELRDMIRKWQVLSKENPNGNVLRFYNWADAEYYEVVVNNFQLMRSVGRPLLYQYTIQMMVLKDLQEWSWEVEDELSDYLVNPKKRAPLAEESLESEVEFVNSVVNQETSEGLPYDISGLTSGTQEWGGLIAKGENFYDTVTNSYKTIEGVISDVSQFAKDIQMFTSGASNFIRKPFELVKDMAISIGDVINALCSVANIPHELVRSFREMICAINYFPESLFKGFTNPSLFEGASNCGSTLGIPEAPVSGYDNSFTATVQLPPERGVSQHFPHPQSILTLKKKPLRVIRVRLNTDISGTGNDYLDTWIGKQVRLTTVPNAEVVVDYVVQQNTVQNMMLLQASTSKILIEGDTLERISEEMYGDPSKWKTIALFNNLEYPFIVGNDFQTEIKATGMVRFYRKTTYTDAIVIPRGMHLYVPEYQGTEQIDFITTKDTLLNLANNFVDVPVEAVAVGAIGNVGPGRIVGFSPNELPTWPVLSISKIGNITSTLGGKTWRVLKPGAIIQVPKTSKDVVSTVVGARVSYNDLFGIDIALKDGEFGFDRQTEKDLQRVFGVKTLGQALRNRIGTKKKFYYYHPEYGTNIPYYIGRKNNSHWQDLVRLDIRSACLLDPRIDRIQTFRMVITGDTILVDLDAIPINQQTPLHINLVA